MNKEAQEYLDQILKKDPDRLTQYEIDFLRARRLYLKKSQMEEYKSVLEPNPEDGTVKKNVKPQKTN